MIIIYNDHPGQTKYDGLIFQMIEVDADIFEDDSTSSVNTKMLTSY